MYLLLSVLPMLWQTRLPWSPQNQQSRRSSSLLSSATWAPHPTICDPHISAHCRSSRHFPFMKLEVLCDLATSHHSSLRLLLSPYLSAPINWLAFVPWVSYVPAHLGLRPWCSLCPRHLTHLLSSMQTPIDAETSAGLLFLQSFLHSLSRWGLRRLPAQILRFLPAGITGHTCAFLWLLRKCLLSSLGSTLPVGWDCACLVSCGDPTSQHRAWQQQLFNEGGVRKRRNHWTSLIINASVYQIAGSSITLKNNHNTSGHS